VTYEYLFCPRRVNGPGHPLNERLRCHCRGLVPRVPRAASYSKKNLDMARFPTATNDWGTKYSILDMIPPLLIEEEGPTT
jgi:hypothetical protein